MITYVKKIPLVNFQVYNYFQQNAQEPHLLAFSSSYVDLIRGQQLHCLQAEWTFFAHGSHLLTGVPVLGDDPSHMNSLSESLLFI